MSKGKRGIWQPVSMQTLLWDFLIFIYQEGRCTKKELCLHRTLVDGKTIDISIQTLLESPQLKHGRKGNDMNCMLVLVFYMPIQAFTSITTNTSQNGGEVAGFSWCTCLVWQHRGMDSESSYLGKIATEQNLSRLQLSFHRAIQH